MNIPKILVSILYSATITAAVYVIIALTLVFTQQPVTLPETTGLNFSRIATTTPENDVPLLKYKTRSGSTLHYRQYKAGLENAPLVILIHGSGWHGGSYQNLAKGLSEVANVLLPDLRGHGPSPIRRGDVDYAGQYEDDLADLIKQHRKPGQKLVFAGHSSGGGLVIRFAGGRYGKMMNGAILLAPFLKYNAPTTRAQSGGWAHALTRRIIGLSMLNNIGITSFNDLPILQFNFPKSILKSPQGKTATTSYSYRLNTSFSPRSDYLKDISKLPHFLLIAGKEDEAFYADKYEPTISPVNTKGLYILLDGVSHLDVIDAPKARTAIIEFIGKI